MLPRQARDSPNVLPTPRNPRSKARSQPDSKERMHREGHRSERVHSFHSDGRSQNATPDSRDSRSPPMDFCSRPSWAHAAAGILFSSGFDSAAFASASHSMRSFLPQVGQSSSTDSVSMYRPHKHSMQ